MVGGASLKRQFRSHFPASWESPGGSEVESAGTLGDLLSRRSAGEGNGNPLQYSCMKKSHAQRSLAGYSLWGGKESDTTE